MLTNCENFSFQRFSDIISLNYEVKYTILLSEGDESHLYV